MPTLVGFTANKLILNSSNFRREMAGLERIMDVYTSRTEDAEFFQELIINGASHKTITGYLSPVPPLSERYANMLVENVESTNEVGGITTYSVTYVGLFRELKPKPIISYQPVDRYVYQPYSISIEFVELIGDVGSSEEFSFIKKYRIRESAPREINGYAMPRSSVAPFAGELGNADILLKAKESQFFRAAIGAQQSFEQNIQREDILLVEGATLVSRPPSGPATVSYLGFVITGISYQRYGKAAHGFLTIAESANYSFIANGQAFGDTLNYQYGF